jgi:uncharacterized membrane protein YhhN
MAVVFEILYFVVALTELYAELADHKQLKFVSKPLMMVTLALFYFFSTTGKRNTLHKLVLASFFFSWVGDVALMFVYKNPSFFLLGLSGFLVTHILYTSAFYRVSGIDAPALLPKRWWLLLPLVAYMVGLLSALIPAINNVPETKPVLFPVIAYSIAIAVMVIFSINRYKRVSDASFVMVFFGALMFMFSDSIIAVNRFIQPVPSAGIAIMATYLTAQYLIAKGCLVQFNIGKSK